MGYVTVQNMRDEGLSDTVKYPDGQVQLAIDLASQYIDRTTRQWFESRSLTVLLDGQGSDRLFLPVPVITLAELYINLRFDASEVLPAADYVVYNGRSLPDDRYNPKVELVNMRRSLFQVGSLSYGKRVFMKGKRNQKLVGAFGFTEADNSTPKMIQRACKKMALRFVDKLAENGTGTTGSTNSGTVIGESTDGHFIQYAMPSATGVKGATFGISKDPEVEQILALYKAPIGLAVPGTPDFDLG